MLYISCVPVSSSTTNLCFDCVLVCVRCRPRSERRRTRQRAVLWAGERGPVPRPRARRTGLPRRLRRRQVQSHPLMHVSVLVFIRVSWIHATTTSWSWISCWNPCHWVAWFSTWNPNSRSCGGMNRIFPFYKRNPMACFINCICFACMKTRLDSHPLICDDHSLTT